MVSTYVSTLLIRIPGSFRYDEFFPWLGKRVARRKESMKSGWKGQPTKRRIEFREKSTIRLTKTRHVISLHVSTRSSVIDGFESPSKVAPLFRGTYLLVLFHPLCAAFTFPTHLPFTRMYLLQNTLFSYELSRYYLTWQWLYFSFLAFAYMNRTYIFVKFLRFLKTHIARFCKTIKLQKENTMEKAAL